MATFGELNTRVRTQVIDLPTAVTNNVPLYVRAGVNKLQTKHNFWVQDAQQDYITVLSTRLLGVVPANLKEWRSAPWMVTFDGRTRPLTLQLPSEGIYPDINETDTNYPLVLTVGLSTDDNGSRVVNVYPLPDGGSDYTDGEYRIKLPYVKYLAALSADGDTNWFTVNAEEYIFHFATALAFEADWDYEHAAAELELAKVEFNDVVMRDKHLRMSQVNELVPHWRGQNSSALRW